MTPLSALYSLPAFRCATALSRLLPLCFSRNCSEVIGRAGYRRAPAARDALRVNLHRATGATGAALDAMCHRNVMNFSRMLADYFYCAGRPAQSSWKLIERWHGFEHLVAARDRGCGVIVVTAHLGNWELGGTALAIRGMPMTIITLDEPTTALTGWRDRYRQRVGIKTIPVGPGREFAFVEMIRALRQNECLAMIVDRPYTGTGTPVRFFGAEAEFSTAPALLAQHTGAAIVPAFVVRGPHGRYLSFAEPEIEMQPPGADPRAALLANTQAIATVFESIIPRYPEQWFNYVPLWRPAAVAEAREPQPLAT